MIKRFNHIPNISKNFVSLTPSKIIIPAVLLGISTVIFAGIGYVTTDGLGLEGLIELNIEVLSILYKSAVEGSTEYFFSGGSASSALGVTVFAESYYKFLSLIPDIFRIGFSVSILAFIADIAFFVLRKTPFILSMIVATCEIGLCVGCMFFRIKMGMSAFLWFLILGVLMLIYTIKAKDLKEAGEPIIDRLKSVYLVVSDKGINGVAFQGHSEYPHPFEVEFSKIKSVSKSEVNYLKGKYSNLEILTENATLHLGIDCCDEAIRYIKRGMEEAASAPSVTA